MNEKAETLMELKARLERITSELDQYNKIALFLAVAEHAHELVSARQNLEKLVECINTIFHFDEEEKSDNLPVIVSNTTETLQ
ncbi:MAG: hypothetical protein KA369_12560 [Spirochaetes bacterium]|nr:hypothetical protein [Spirochaetota bacterium]